MELFWILHIPLFFVIYFYFNWGDLKPDKYKLFVSAAFTLILDVFTIPFVMIFFE
jgi:hypothetical protein